MSKALIIQSHDVTAPQSLAALSGAYLATVQRDLSPETFKAYSKHLGAFLSWLDQQPAHNHIRENLKNFKALLQETNKPRSTNLKLTAIRQFLKHLHNEGFIPENPSGAIPNIKTGDATKSGLDKYQLHDLLQRQRAANTTARKRDAALVHLAIANGLRMNEIVNINLDDFDTHNGDQVIHLLRKGYSTKDNYTILSAQTLEVLRKHIGDRTQGALFESTHGGNLTSDTASRMIKREMRAVGIDSKNITAHSLRHTFARLGYEAGADLLSLSQALNHKSVSTTQVYLRSIERHTNAPEKMITL